MGSRSLAHKIWNFPSYSTILTQTFSPDGNHLALGNDRGIVAIFSVNDLLSSGRNASGNDSGALCSFFFQALDSGTNDKFSAGDSVNVLVSTKDFLVAAVTVRAANSAKILAWHWGDLVGSQIANGSQVLEDSFGWHVLYWWVAQRIIYSTGSPRSGLDHRVVERKRRPPSHRNQRHGGGRRRPGRGRGEAVRCGGILRRGLRERGLRRQGD
jgi:hypothetical protein